MSHFWQLCIKSRFRSQFYFFLVFQFWLRLFGIVRGCHYISSSCPSLCLSPSLSLSLSLSFALIVWPKNSPAVKIVIAQKNQRTSHLSSYPISVPYGFHNYFKWIIDASVRLWGSQKSINYASKMLDHRPEVEVEVCLCTHIHTQPLTHAYRTFIKCQHQHMANARAKSILNIWLNKCCV